MLIYLPQKKYHNFLISFDDILVHNLEPFFATVGFASMHMPIIAEGATTLLSSCNPYLIAAGVIIAGGYALYDWVTSKHSNKKKAKQLQRVLEIQRQQQLELERKNATSGSPGPQKDPDDKDNNKKKRIINTMTLPEAKRQPIFKKHFRYYKDGTYQASDKIKKYPNLKNVRYIKWDHLHNEWEVYCKNKKHLGAFNPTLKKRCKGPVLGREL